VWQNLHYLIIWEHFTTSEFFLNVHFSKSAFLLGFFEIGFYLALGENIQKQFAKSEFFDGFGG
jgi:hypothetical protein